MAAFPLLYSITLCLLPSNWAKLVNWVWFPLGSYWRLEKRYLRPIQPRAGPWWMGAVHARCCHWFATSAALTTKAAAWLWAEASRDGRRRLLVTLRKEYKSECIDVNLRKSFTRIVRKLCIFARRLLEATVLLHANCNVSLCVNTYQVQHTFWNNHWLNL